MANKRKKIDTEYKTIYAFRYFNLSNIPVEFRNDFMKLYGEFQANFKPSLPTQESLNRAKDVLYSPIFRTPKEKQALTYVRRMRFFPNVLNDARQECLYAIEGVVSQKYGQFKPSINIPVSCNKQIFLDFILRHDCVMPTVQKLSKLRCKIRRSLKLEKNARVGF